MPTCAKSVPAVALICCALAGCGSSNGSLSYGAFSAAAEKLCLQADTQLGTLRTLHPKSLAATADALDKLRGSAEQLDSGMAALHGPAALQRARDNYVADGRVLVARLKQAASAARAGQIVAFRKSFDGFGALVALSDRDGRRLGARACSSTG